MPTTHRKVTEHPGISQSSPTVHIATADSYRRQQTITTATALCGKIIRVPIHIKMTRVDCPSCRTIYAKATNQEDRA